MAEVTCAISLFLIAEHAVYRSIREVWPHLVVAKYYFVVQRGKNCDQSSSQKLEKLEEFVVLHILSGLL